MTLTLISMTFNEGKEGKCGESKEGEGILF